MCACASAMWVGEGGDDSEAVQWRGEMRRVSDGKLPTPMLATQRHTCESTLQSPCHPAESTRSQCPTVVIERRAEPRDDEPTPRLGLARLRSHCHAMSIHHTNKSEPNKHSETASRVEVRMMTERGGEWEQWAEETETHM